MTAKVIRLELSVAETNLVLSALGECAYREVYDLIASIHAQAAAQIDGEQLHEGPP